MLPERGPRPAPGTSQERPQKKALLALTVTTSVLASFALGVLVGRQQAAPPVADTAPPAAAPAASAPPEEPTIEMIRPDGTAANVGTFAETPPSQPAAPAAVPPTPTAQPAAAPAAGPAEQPTPSPAPAATPSPAPTDKTRRASSASGIYTVQIAAFRDRNSAQRLALQLEAKGYDAYVQRSNVDGKGIWYRVRVGAFDSKDDAQKLARRIQASEGRSAYVTIR